jgi:hypothetical protein
MAELYRYAAFISYSSKDAKFAQRLHRALESYGIPSSLGKFDLIGGGKANRIYPVFRDREELSAGHLGDQIEANLKASAALIVVCSPHGAASPWVQKEIEFFASQGRHAKIFAIIPDSAPLTDEQGADCTQSCFPPAFRGDALAGDKLEPLAADARKAKDGFRNAWLKIVAGVVGVSPGQIMDRDRARQRLRRQQAAFACGLILVLAAYGLGTLDALNRRTQLATFAEAIEARGNITAALPFALAGDREIGAVAYARAPRAGELLRRVSALPLLHDLGSVQALFVSADASVIITYNNDNTGTYHGPDGMRQLGILGVLETIGQVSLARNGAGFVIRPQGGRGVYFDLHQGGRQLELGALRYDPRLSDDGAVLVTQAFDGTVRHYNTRTHQTRILGNFGELARFWGLNLSADGRVLTVVRHDGRATYFDLSSGEVRSLGGLGLLRDRFGLAMSSNGRSMVTLKESGEATLFDLATNEVTDLGQLAQQHEFRLSDDGSVLITRAQDGVGTIRNLESGAIRSLGPLGEPYGVDGLTLSGSGNALIVRTSDDSINYYDLRSDAPMRNMAAANGYFALSENGASLAVLTPDRTLMYYNLSDGTTRNLGQHRALDQFDFTNMSADGTGFFVKHVSVDQQYAFINGMTFFDLATGEPGVSLGAPEYSRFSDDGTALILKSQGETMIFAVGARRGTTNDGSALANSTSVVAICATSGRAMRPFPSSIRRDEQSGVNERLIRDALIGRPWSPCDWRGLAALAPDQHLARGDREVQDDWFEGVRQWVRLIQIRAFGAPDYKCGEVNAAGTVDASRVASCRRAGVPDDMIAPPS